MTADDFKILYGDPNSRKPTGVIDASDCRVLASYQHNIGPVKLAKLILRMQRRIRRSKRTN